MHGAAARVPQPHGDRRRARPRLAAAARPADAGGPGRGAQTRDRRAARRAAGSSAHPAVDERRAIPGFGALLSFDVADGAAARRVETATQLIVNATSLGGVTSTMESRHRWEGDRVPEGLLRLSVGLEPVEALWADLEQALART